jgi:hypothetical protein
MLAVKGLHLVVVLMLHVVPLLMYGTKLLFLLLVSVGIELLMLVVMLVVVLLLALLRRVLRLVGG